MVKVTELLVDCLARNEEKATILAVGSIHTIFQNTSIFRYMAEMISRQNVNYALHIAEQKCTIHSKLASSADCLHLSSACYDVY
jgi:tRNA C32,U32 (ribose-2'-O)-methylase TrmJ